MTKRYERIAIKPEGGRRRSGWFEVLGESPTFLVLRPVDKHGEDRSYYRTDGTLVDVQELVSIQLVAGRQKARMNPVYGELETTECRHHPNQDSL